MKKWFFNIIADDIIRYSVFEVGELMFDAYRKYWKNYFNVKGRLKRSSFWFALLFNLIITSTLVILLFLSPNIPMIATILLITFMFVALNIVPTFTAMIRRIHDTGRHAYLFIGYAIYTVFIIIFYRFMIGVERLILLLLFGGLTVYFLIIFLHPTRYELIDRRRFF